MEVVLIGKGPGFETAPRKGEGPITWGVNDVVGHRECDVDFWFDRCWEKDTAQDRVIVASVNHTKTPMYSTQEWDDIPTSISYPLEEIIEHFGVDNFCDSCCFMLALAIYQKFDEISLYGFNYSWGSSFVAEKPGVEFWLGVALARGITLNIYGEHSDLLRTNHPRHQIGQIYSYGTEQTKGRIGIKMSDTPEKEPRKAKTFTLNVTDRVALMNLFLPKGDYKMLKTIKWLHSEIWFSAEERRILNIRQVLDENEMPYFIWDENEIPDLTLEFDVDAQEAVAKRLEELNKEEKMGREHFELYEQFCIGK